MRTHKVKRYNILTIENGKTMETESDNGYWVKHKDSNWLESRLKEAEEVLKWYANPHEPYCAIFRGVGIESGPAPVLVDEGKRARSYFKERAQ